MEVTFFRHGIAVDRADPRAPVDFERPLTLEGKNRTEAAARGLRTLISRPSLILTSPYRRCVQSARLVASAFGLQRKVIREVEELRPDAEPKALWPEIARRGRFPVLCVGHGGSIEPIAGVALGFQTAAGQNATAGAEGSNGPTNFGQLALEASSGFGLDAAVYRALHLKKAGALHLDVSFEPSLVARLLWLLAPKILRQLGRS